MSNWFHSFFFLVLASVSLCSKAENVYPFGRLFTSETERRLLDNLKSTALPVNASAGFDINIDEKPTMLQFSGYTKHADGPDEIWIDGKSSLTDPAFAYKASLLDNNKVSIRGNLVSFALKPGQIWLVETKSVKENYDAKASKLNLEVSTEEPDPIEAVAGESTLEEIRNKGDKALPPITIPKGIEELLQPLGIKLPGDKSNGDLTIEPR